MGKYNDIVEAIIPPFTNCDEIGVKATPVDNINRIEGELTYDDVGRSLKELNICPSMFLKVILEKLLKDRVKRHQLKKWLEQEINNKAEKKTQNEHTEI